MKIHEALSRLADFARCGYGDAELLMVVSAGHEALDVYPAAIQDFNLAHYTVEQDGRIKIWDPSAELPGPPDAGICIVAQNAG